MRLWTIMPFLALGMALPGPTQGGSHPGSGPPEAQSSPAADPMDPDLDGMVLPWSFFCALAEEDNTMVIDVRAAFLGGPTPPGMETARPIPLSVFKDNFVARKANQEKTLLIFDETGKTYSDLHRHLHENGYMDYFFLSGGVENTMKLLERGS